MKFQVFLTCSHFSFNLLLFVTSSVIFHPFIHSLSSFVNVLFISFVGSFFFLFLNIPIGVTSLFHTNDLQVLLIYQGH